MKLPGKICPEKKINRISLVLILGIMGWGLPHPAAVAGAMIDSPVGRWKTIDDKTEVVRIWEEESIFYGEVVERFEKPADGVPEVCERCRGDLKNAPIIGLRIIWDMRRVGDEWTGGRILDPDNGKIYRAKFRLIDEGKKLKVRGFIGISLIGRSQIWHRTE